MKLSQFTNPRGLPAQAAAGLCPAWALAEHFTSVPHPRGAPALDIRPEVRDNEFRPSWLLFGDSLEHG